MRWPCARPASRVVPRRRKSWPPCRGRGRWARASRCPPCGARSSRTRSSSSAGSAHPRRSPSTTTPCSTSRCSPCGRSGKRATAWPRSGRCRASGWRTRAAPRSSGRNGRQRSAGRSKRWPGPRPHASRLSAARIRRRPARPGATPSPSPPLPRTCGQRFRAWSGTWPCARCGPMSAPAGWGRRWSASPRRSSLATPRRSGRRRPTPTRRPRTPWRACRQRSPRGLRST